MAAGSAAPGSAAADGLDRVSVLERLVQWGGRGLQSALQEASAAGRSTRLQLASYAGWITVRLECCAHRGRMAIGGRDGCMGGHALAPGAPSAAIAAGWCCRLLDCPSVPPDGRHLHGRRTALRWLATQASLDQTLRRL